MFSNHEFMSCFGRDVPAYQMLSNNNWVYEMHMVLVEPEMGRGVTFKAGHMAGT